jgi:hypothetical protein
MFKTRDFLPVIITGLVVIALAVAGLVESGQCAGDWTCWFVSPFQILFGRYQPPADATSPGSFLLLMLTEIGGKAILLVGAFLSGVRIVVSAVRHDFRTALARRMQNHAIVCGLGETGMQIVRNMRSAGQAIVVIDHADDTVNGATCDQLGIAVVKGDATNADVLKLAGVLSARTIIACTGDDASNMDVALQVKEMIRDRRHSRSDATVVLAEMRSPWLFSRFENRDRRALGSRDVELRLFNAQESAARLLLRSLQLPPGPELDCGAFAIFGFGHLGQQVMLHFVRAMPATTGSRVKIVVFEKAAAECERRFLQAYPAAARLAEVSFVEAVISPDSRESWATVEGILHGRPLLGAAICFDDDQTSLYAALGVRRQLDDLLRIHVPVFLRLGKYRHLGQFAASMESLEKQPHRLRIFGNLEEVLGFDILIKDKLDTLARVMHAQYRDSRQFPGETHPADQPWNLLPEALKMSNRRRADNLPFLLAKAGLLMVPTATPAAIQFNPDEIELLARLEHRRWAIERQLLGYSYGEVRSEFPPRHELLVEWEHLPEAERERNRNDFAVLPKVLAEAGYEVQREHRILAMDDCLDAALSELEVAAHNGNQRSVVIADVDSVEGRKAAELALGLADVVLWLVSSEYPRSFRDFQQIEAAFEAAAGWIIREQICRA